MVDDTKSKPMVDDTKAKPMVDDTKAKPMDDTKSKPELEERSKPLASDLSSLTSLEKDQKAKTKAVYRPKILQSPVLLPSAPSASPFELGLLKPGIIEHPFPAAYVLTATPGSQPAGGGWCVLFDFKTSTRESMAKWHVTFHAQRKDVHAVCRSGSHRARIGLFNGKLEETVASPYCPKFGCHMCSCVYNEGKGLLTLCGVAWVWK
jgi:hypothetical protein